MAPVQFRGMLFTWDGISSDPEQAFEIAAPGGVTAMYPWRNNLTIFAGYKGEIYQFKGASVTKVLTLPNQLPGDDIFVSPNAVMDFKGNLVFGVSRDGDIQGVYTGLYQLAQDTSGAQVLTVPYKVGNGTIEIFALEPINQDQFYCSRKIPGGTWGSVKLA